MSAEIAKTITHRLRTPEAAAYLGLSASTLEKFRLYGGGPIYYKAGPKIVVYDVDDLDAWVRAGRRTSTSQNRAAEVVQEGGAV
jgi:hypothetical protein